MLHLVHHLLITIEALATGATIAIDMVVATNTRRTKSTSTKRQAAAEVQRANRLWYQAPYGTSSPAPKALEFSVRGWGEQRRFAGTIVGEEKASECPK